MNEPSLVQAKVWDRVKKEQRVVEEKAKLIAHPPCQRWGRFSEGSMTKKTEKTGDDGGCFEAALRALTLFGGVLEHPAHSKAWDHFGIPKPGKTGWSKAGPNLWVCEVEQGHYGHPARKKTWILACGPRPQAAGLIWGPCEQRLPAKRLAERGYESARRCGIIANMCSKHRQRTPPEFRDLLLSIATNCNQSQATA